MKKKNSDIINEVRKSVGPKVKNVRENESPSDLKDKICVPCQGGIPPLTIEEAKSLLQKTPGWELQEEATRLYRSFTVNDFQTALDFVNIKRR